MNYFRDDRFFVFQGVFTPTFDYIMKSPFSNLRGMAETANKVVKEWLDSVNPFEGIVITDFSIDGFPGFTRKVFSKNW